MRKSWIVAGIAALSIGGIAAAVTQSAPPKAGEIAARDLPQPVRVTEVHFDRAAPVKRFTGTIRPAEEAALGFRLAGKLVERTATLGTHVTKGTLLARLDDTDARLQVTQTEAEDRAARIDLSRVEADLNRARQLFREGHVTKAALDRATSAAAEAASRAERGAQALRLAQNQLSYTELRAETDGIVTATLAEPGQVLGAGTPVVTLAREGALDVVFALPEQDRATLTQATATAELWETGSTYALTPRDVAPDVDPSGRTYRVRLSMVAPDAAATLGRTVTVALTLPAGTPSAPLPLAAVLDDGTGPVALRVAGDRVQRLPVTIERLTATTAFVSGDLSDGDRVISLGAHKVDPDRPVRIVETHPAPES